MILKNKGLPVISRFNNNKTKDNHKGFTIVEVMIVLAIAGLILAVVFIAVPALQRNQRNSARRNDIAYLRAQFDAAVANNGGRQPTAAQFFGLVEQEELNWIGLGPEGNSATVVTNDAATAAVLPTNDGGIYWIDDFTGTAAGHVYTINQLGMYVGRRCPAGPLVATGILEGNANTGTQAGNRTSIAWVYVPEGSDIPICQSDIN